MNCYDRLQKLYLKIDELINMGAHTDIPEFKSWHADCLRFFSNNYGPDSIEYKNFSKIRFVSALFDIEQQRLWCANGLKTAKQMFESLLDDLKDEISETETNEPTVFEKVFIVHGHDGELKYKVSSMLQKLGIEPIILHEQPNSSKTIIEKIEKYGSDAQAAIILFTPDDVGKANSEEDTKLRGRQNVVFEAGYFMGLLGRSKTILVLSDDTIELPGDLSGVVYSGSSSEFDIAKELKFIGFNIDLNKLM